MNPKQLAEPLVALPPVLPWSRYSVEVIDLAIDLSRSRMSTLPALGRVQRLQRNRPRQSERDHRRQRR